MNNLTITDIHLRYGASHRPEPANPLLLVGLQLEDGQLFWADVIDRSGQVLSQSFLTNAGTTLRDYLSGKELSTLVALEKSQAMNPLAQLTVPIMIEREVEVMAGGGEVQSENKRRALLSAIGQPQPQSEIVKVESTVHLPAAIKRGVKHGLLQAALANGLYQLPQRGRSPAPKLITPLDLATDVSRFAAADILSLTIPQQDDPTRFGANGEGLQKHIGEVAQWISAQAEAIGRTTLPKLMIQLNGLYGALFENKLGKILGAFYGINYASKAVQLLLVDPLMPTDFETGIKQYKDLRKMVKSRGIKVELMLGAGVSTIDSLNQWLDADFFDRILLSSGHFEGPYHLIEALDKCRSHATEIVFEVDQQGSSDGTLFWTKVAYDLNVNYLIPPPGQHFFAESQNFLTKIAFLP